MITEAVILRESGQYDPEIVSRLYLDSLSINIISSLDRCINLTDLSLSHNEISEIRGLDTLSNLRRLNLSFNKIRDLSNLHCLVNLEYLDLRSNLVSNITEFEKITMLTKLFSISFRGSDGEDPNPICSHPSYFDILSRTLPSLNVLDGGLIELSSFNDEAAILNSLSNVGPSPSSLISLPVEDWFQTSSSRTESPSLEEEISSLMERTREKEEVVSNLLVEGSKPLVRKAMALENKVKKVLENEF